MSLPVFTVIIPTFNAENTIEAAINSITSQTLNNWELLVIDGVSTDKTINIAKKIEKSDSRIKIEVAKDKGIYDAMNKGIKKAKGQWLYFMGADDTIYNSNVLNTILDAINENKNTKLAYGNVSLNKPLGYHHEGLVYAGEFDEYKLLVKNICHQSAFYHKSIFQQFGLYKTQYKIFADYDFNLNCFNRVETLFVNTIIANFNVGGNSKENQQADKQFANDFLKNMIYKYGYHYKNEWFAGKKKQVFSLMISPQNIFKLTGLLKAIQIIFYQTFNKKHKHTLA